MANGPVEGMIGFSIVTATTTSFTVDMYHSALGVPVKTYTYSRRANRAGKLPKGCEC